MRSLYALAISAILAGAAVVPVHATVVEDARRAAYEATMQNPEAVYDRIRNALAKQCKSEANMEATFTPTPRSRLLGGYIEGMEVRMKGGFIDSCRLESAHLTGSGVVFDVARLFENDEFFVKSAKRIDLQASVSEEAFNDVLTQQSRNLRVGNPKVSLRDDCLVFSGDVKTLFLRNRVRAAGRLSVAPEGKVNFHLSGLKLSSVPIPGFLVRSMVRRINPIADFSKFSFWQNYNLNLRSIRIEKGKIVLSSYEDGTGPDTGEAAETMQLCDDPRRYEGPKALSTMAVMPAN